LLGHHSSNDPSREIPAEGKVASKAEGRAVIKTFNAKKKGWQGEGCFQRFIRKDTNSGDLLCVQM